MNTRVRRILVICAWALGALAIGFAVLDVWSARVLDTAIARLEGSCPPDTVVIPTTEDAAPLLAAASAVAKSTISASVLDEFQAAYADAVVAASIRAKWPALGPVLALVDQALAKPRCRIPPAADDRSPTTWDLLLLAKVCGTEYTLRLDEQDRSGAIAAAKRCFRYADLLESDAHLLQFLVRNSVLTTSCVTTRRLLAMETDPIAALHEIAPRALTPALSRCLSHEIRYSIDRIDAAIDGSVDITGLGADGRPPWSWKGVPNFIVAPYVRFGLAEHFEYMALVLAHSEPTAENCAALQAASTRMRSDGSFLAQMLAVDFARFLEAEMRVSSEVRMLEVGAVVLAHHRARGAWPDAVSVPPEFELSTSADSPNAVLRSRTLGGAEWNLVPPR